MLKLTIPRILLIVGIAMTVILGYALDKSLVLQSENGDNHKPVIIERPMNGSQPAPKNNKNIQIVKPLNSELLYPYTEQELRLEIDNRRENDDYLITSIIYRSRWKAEKDPIRYGRRWVSLATKYKKIVGEKKIWAIMHLADYDLSHEIHQIHNPQKSTNK